MEEYYIKVAYTKVNNKYNIVLTMSDDLLKRVTFNFEADEVRYEDIKCCLDDKVKIGTSKYYIHVEFNHNEIEQIPSFLKVIESIVDRELKRYDNIRELEKKFEEKTQEKIYITK